MTSRHGQCEWFRDAVIYHVLVDRFAGARRDTCERPVFAGGTPRGIRGKRPHIAGPGLHPLWLAPFYAATSYHGYDVTDYFRVDPHWGTVTDFEDLTAACASAGLRVIADFVPHHCSSRHAKFREAQAGRLRDWFLFSKGRDEYAAYMGIGYLPKLNLANRAVRNHVIRAARFWLSRGLSGYRLDHAIGPSREFWAEFRDEIKAEFPDAVLIGEAPFDRFPLRHLSQLGLRGRFWRGLAARLPGVYGTDLAMQTFVGVLDGCLDFTFQRIVLENLCKPISRELAVDAARKALRRHYARFPDEFLLPTFLDNHDCDRFLYRFRGPQSSVNLRAAVELQFSLPQPPVVYYGTEVGMTQPEGISDRGHHGDNLARQPMIWDEDRWDRELLEFYRDQISRRRQGQG